MGNIIATYLDTETIFKDDRWCTKEVAFFNPSREKGARMFTEVIRTKTDGSEDGRRTFPEIFKDAIQFVEQDYNKDNGDVVLLLGYNIRHADIAPLMRACDQHTISWPSHWISRDICPIVKRVLPFGKHTLQLVRAKLGVPPWEQHSAPADAKGLYDVVKVMAKDVLMPDLVKDFADMKEGLDKASERLLASYKIVPVFYNLSLSGYCKRDKTEPAPYPSALKISAICPSRFEGSFDERIEPPKGVEIDTALTEGLEVGDLKGAEPFAVVYPKFENWLQECLQGDVAGRVVLVAYEEFYRDGKILDRECERAGIEMPKNILHFSLDYVKTCLLPRYDEEYWEKKGVTHTELQKRSLGFPVKPKSENGRDQVFYQLLDHFQISRADDRLSQTHQLYEALVGVDDPAISTAMVKNPNIKTVANAVKTHFVAHPIFLKLETTDKIRGRGEERKFPGIVKIEAYAPFKPLGQRYFEKLVNPEMAIVASAKKYHGISDENVAEALTWDRVSSQYWEWAANDLRSWEKIVHISHGATFAKNVMRVNSERYGLPMRPDVQNFCTMNLAQGLFKGKANHGMDSLTSRYSLENNRDVMTVFDVFTKMIHPLSAEEVFQAIRKRKTKTSSKEIVALVNEAHFAEAKEVPKVEKKEAVVSVKKRDKASKKTESATPQRRSRRLKSKAEEKKNV